MADNSNTVWADAEDSCLAQLATTTGHTVGQNAFIGTDISLQGKVNAFVFAIIGGNNQQQSYTSGAASWHTSAALRGVFTTRDAAMTVACKILDATPYNDLSTSVTRLFVTSHPGITDGLWDDGSNKRIVYHIEIIFDVVYHVITVVE
jgi:hypothetical protein